MESKVIILMATYNGAAFLKQQLGSIVSQTYQNWQLYIRDDQSTDDTLAILNLYALADKRIQILQLEGPHGSPALNFGVLFNHVSTRQFDFLMFADQDDIWHANKIELSLQFIQSLAQSETPNTPLLVYTKFQFIDEKDAEIKQTLEMPPELTLPILLSGNYAYGCTMLLNKALVAKVNLPTTVAYHDYWIALVACAFGKSVLLPQQLVGYRQHSHNSSTNLQSRSAAARFQRYLQVPTSRLPNLMKQHQMFNLFFSLYKHQLTAKKRDLIQGYLKALHQSSLGLIAYMLRNNFRKMGLLPTLAHYFILVRLREKIIEN